MEVLLYFWKKKSQHLVRCFVWDIYLSFDRCMLLYYILASIGLELGKKGK